MCWFFSRKEREWREDVLRKLDRILLRLTNIRKKEIKMSIDLTALTAAVEKVKTVDASVETLLTQLTAKIQTLIDDTNDPATAKALQDLVDTVNAKTDELAAAVVANTPAE